MIKFSRFLFATVSLLCFAASLPCGAMDVETPAGEGLRTRGAAAAAPAGPHAGPAGAARARVRIAVFDMKDEKGEPKTGGSLANFIRSKYPYNFDILQLHNVSALDLINFLRENPPLFGDPNKCLAVRIMSWNKKLSDSRPDQEELNNRIEAIQRLTNVPCQIHSLRLLSGFDSSESPILPKGVYSRFQSLSLCHANIWTLGLFNNISDLRCLELNHNPLGPEIRLSNHFSCPGIEMLSYLENLGLSNCDLKTVKVDLPNIQVLVLDNNDIKILEIKGAPRLAVLSLAGNPNLGLPEKFPLSLLRLDLSNTGLSATAPLRNALRELPNLEMLNLSNNNLSFLPGSVFENLKRLQALNVSGNGLIPLDVASVLEGNPGLRLVDASGNTKVTLYEEFWTKEKVKEYLTTLKKVRIVFEGSQDLSLEWNLSLLKVLTGNNLRLILDKSSIPASPPSDSSE